MEAELHALELAVGSFLLIDKEVVAQIPHEVDQIMDSLPFPLSSRLYSKFLHRFKYRVLKAALGVVLYSRSWFFCRFTSGT